MTPPGAPRGVAAPRSRRPIAAGWALAALAALGLLARAPGISRDEAALLARAEAPAALRAGDAPPLAPALAAATHAAAARAGLPPVHARRLGSALAGATLAALLALVAFRLAGPAGALLAPALFLLAPRHLHAGLVATADLALATLSLAAALAWRRAAGAPRAAARLGAAALAGILLGAAIAARADAWVLFPAFALHAALGWLLDRRAAAGDAPAGPGGRAIGLVVVVAVAAATLALAWPGALAGLPRGDLGPFAPSARGRPALALLVPVLALPATLLLLYVGGAAHAAIRVVRAVRLRLPLAAVTDDALLALAAAAALAGSTLADAPVGARPALHAMPFLALLGARALLRVAAVAWPRRAGALAGALALLVLYPAARATVRAVPRGTSAWNALVGFAPGAASRRLPRQDGGDAAAALLPAVNARAREGARIWWPAASPHAVRLYAREGRLRPDLELVAEPGDADLALVTLDGSRDAEYRAWTALRTARPAAGVYEDEVPLALVYARAGAWR